MKTSILIIVGSLLSLNTGIGEERHPSLPIPTYYEVTIRSGENLSALAIRHRTSIEKLVETNGLVSANQIVAGQTLRIKRRDSGTWTKGRIQILKGDTLNLLALVVGVRPEELARANGIAAHDRLVAGEWLLVPHSTETRKSSGASGAAHEEPASTPKPYAYPDPIGVNRPPDPEERIKVPAVPEVEQDPQTESELVAVKIAEAISVNDAADQFGLSLETLLRFNPELRSNEEIEKDTVLLVPKVFLGID